MHAFSRRGNANNTLVFILAGVVVVLVGVVIGLVLYMGQKNPVSDEDDPRNDNKPVIKSGETADPKKGEKTAGKDEIDKKLLKESLEAGKTYSVVQRAILESKGYDRDWPKERVQIVIVPELVYTRKIESNDGLKLVEVRKIVKHRVAKLLTSAAKLDLKIGLPDQAILTDLDKITETGKMFKFDSAKPLLTALAPSDAEKANVVTNSKAFGAVGRLQGKEVRITWIAGLGVMKLEPMGCELNAWEREYFFRKDLTNYTRFMVDSNVKIGATIEFPGKRFSDMLEMIDPAPAPAINGKVVVKREADRTEGSLTLAHMEIVPEQSELKMVDESKDSIETGSFKPTGWLRFDLAGNYVQGMYLDGKMDIKVLPKNSPLKTATLDIQPTMKVSYHCTKK